MSRALAAAVAVALLLPLAAPRARAQEADAMSFFAEEAKVFTASRRDQDVREVPVSVEVITADDIRRSGALDLWDLLRFRAGLDVAENREPKLGNRAVVAVRGMPTSFVNNLLVLIDGRSVYDADSGGVLWEQLPVQLQDIERIEVVRGPNAALYGSNAGSGVINVITRRPEGAARAEGSAVYGTMGGDRPLWQESSALENGTGPFAFRLSQTHRADQGFPGPDGGRVGDFLYSNKANFRGSWEPDDATGVEAFAGGSWDTTGQPASIMPGDDAQARVRSHFEMARLNRALSESSAVEAMLSRSERTVAISPAFGGFSDPDPSAQIDARTVQYDADFQHRFDAWDGRLGAVWGGNWRRSTVSSDQRYAGIPRIVDDTERGFASASLKLDERTTAAAAASLEDSGFAGVQPAFQVALLREVARGQTLRLSHALAPAQPSAFKKYADNQTSSATAIVGNPEAPAEHLSSYEAGYLGEFLGRRLSAELNLYYQDNRDLGTLEAAGTSGGVTTRTYATDQETIARGLEAKLGWRWSRAASVYANYSYENVTARRASPMLERGTPPHSFNAGGTAALGGFAATVNAGWRDGYLAGDQTALIDVRPYWRLDARLSWSRGAGKVFAGGRNLAQPTHQAEFNGPDVPRTLYAGASLKF